MPPRLRALVAAALFCTAALGLGCGRPAGEAPPNPAPTPSVSDTGEGTAGFARAVRPRTFRFPEEYGPHGEYRLEWWYYTGNLETPSGRHFGFELTFFRIGMAPGVARRPSRWASNELYMAHFAVTDVAAGRFRGFERLSRAALGLSGARAVPYRVWLEDWSAEGSAEGPFPMRLHAAQGGVGIDLLLGTDKPVVLQGDRGLSRKGGEPGNASYYYSLTRMPATGTVRIGGSRFQVAGLAWLDREWSTSALGKDQSGWDWFGLQLSDGRELMFYRLRDRHGNAVPWSAGTIVDARGASRPLSRKEAVVEPLGEWRSPKSGIRYPSGWRLRVPEEGLDLTVSPYAVDQELRGPVTYWEGAVSLVGTANGRPLEGSGYVELTGYGGAGP